MFSSKLLPAAGEGHHQCRPALPSLLLRSIPWLGARHVQLCLCTLLIDLPEGLACTLQHMGAEVGHYALIMDARFHW